jgi:hypothetical protein
VLLVARMRVLAVAALVLATTASAVAQPGMTQPTSRPTGAYQPRWAQPQPQLDLELKSSGEAMLWAIGTTVAAVATIGASFHEDSGGLFLLGAGLMVIGPSAGHIYVGEGRHAVNASFLRAGGLLIFTLGVVDRATSISYCETESSSFGDCDRGYGPVTWIGGLIVAGSALYDIYDAGRAVNRYNDRRRKAAVQLAPTMMSTRGGSFTPGVGVIGSF